MPERESAASVTLHPAGSLLSFGPFRFDRANRILARDQEEIPLPPRVLGVLEHLVERPGTVVSKQALMNAVWKDAFVTETSLTEAVSQVRLLLGDDPQQPTYIQTVHRRGYRFVAPVTFLGAAAGSLRLADRPRVSLAENPPPDTAAPRGTGTLTPPRPRWIGLLALLVLLSGAEVWVKFARTPYRSSTRLAIPLPTGEGIALPGPPALALAPDGKLLVYALARNGVSQLHRRAMDQFESTPISGTEGGTSPFFSPDGDWIGFFADGKLRKVARSGEAPITLADAESGMGGSWGSDGFIVFAPKERDGLFRVAASGGTPQRLTEPDAGAGELGHSWPEVLPGSRAVLFTVWPTAGLEEARIAVRSLVDGTPPKVLVAHGTYGRYAPTGHLFFTRKSRLMAAALDVARPDHVGEPTGLFDGVTVDWFTGAAQMASSATGSLVYVPGTHEVPSHTLGFVGTDGAERPLATPARPFMNLDLARDGRRIAATIHEGTGSDLWAADVERGALTRLTFEAHNIEPAWAPDGRSVTFASSRRGPFNLFSAPVDGDGKVTRLLESPRNQYPDGWSADGRLLLFTELHPETGSDLWVLGPETREARPLLNTRFDEHSGAFSPDGRFVAYVSNESRRSEVYVRPYPRWNPKVSVSTDGGVTPLWSPDGRELYYVSNDFLMAAHVSLAPEFRAGPPRRLFALKQLLAYAVTPDGKGFVVIRGEKTTSPPQINVVLDWFEELKRLTAR